MTGITYDENPHSAVMRFLWHVHNDTQRPK